ncbi:MAG: Hpt domain-containing protein [Sphingobium sp. 32-64-5]|nr:MAG: Hpt domain-containing protein [Sphingobium sp. 32-64-5]
MSYESGNLDAALSAVAGDDPTLRNDLRRAFLESADRQIALAERAMDEGSWRQALWRLKGLSGSFGLLSLIALAEEVESAAPGDAQAVRRLRAALTLIAEV